MRRSGRYVAISLHILIWTVILLLPFLVSNPDSGYAIGYVPGSFFTIAGIIHLFIFYFNAYYLFPKWCNRRRWWIYVPLSVALVGGSLMLKYAILSRWFPDTLLHETTYRMVFAPSFGAYAISIIYRKVVDGIQRERLQNERQATHLAAELKFLRSQINPHFLFNTLTGLVSLARKKSDRLEPALIQLSDLMRYMLYETRDKKVPLQTELDYLGNYISLQRLRFDEDVLLDVQIDVPKWEAIHLMVEPMLLIPFVENAFKHSSGLSGKKEIKVHAALADKQLRFVVRNPTAAASRPVSRDGASGIGLANIKTRLTLLYPNAYTLSCGEADGWFSVDLTLQL